MESNYETLRLNTQIETAAFHGRRFFQSNSCHDNGSKGSKVTPVIDYFDYVNPSDADENERVDTGDDELEVEKDVTKSETLQPDSKVDTESRSKSELKDNGFDNDNDDINKERKYDMDNVEEEKYDKISAEINDTLTVVYSSTAEEVTKCLCDDDKKPKNDVVDDACTNNSGLKTKTKRKVEYKRRNKILKRDVKLLGYKDDDSVENKDEPSNKEQSTQENELSVKNDKGTTLAVEIKECESPSSADNDVEHEEEKEVLESNVSGLHTELTCKPEYRTALQVDTSYQAGVSSDSNCSQYSASSWTSEHDTSSSLDPSPNLWHSYIDSGVSLGTSTGGIYSDTSDVSGEDCSYYDNTNNQRYPTDFQQTTDGKYVQIRTFFPRHKLFFSNSNCYSNGAIKNNGAFPNVNIYSESDSVGDYDGYGNYSEPVVESETNEISCDYCQFCACSEYEGCPLEQMLPGDIFYYSSNSVVLCVKQNRQCEHVDIVPKQVRM